jgi:CheY-like chemotaxis protein
MSDVIFYVGSSTEDFSVISATFSQFDRLFELHFISPPRDILARLNHQGPLPSLIFMDISADRGAILALVQHLKSHRDIRWVPIIFVGAAGDRWGQDEVIGAGGAALLRAPLRPDSLQRLFSATGDLLVHPNDAALLASSPQVIR